MKPVDFALLRPRSLAEAVAALAAHEDAKALAGGQSLVPLLNFRLARPSHVVDLAGIPGLDTITAEGEPGDDTVVLGAMVRQAAAERSALVAERVPLLTAALPHVAHRPVRTRGTVGGSLAHADPAAELPAVATALDATLVAVGPGGTRRIPAGEFFTGYLSTALAEDEVLVQVRFPARPPGTGAAFQEMARRRGDFALVAVAAQVTLADGAVAAARIALAGVASTPVRARDAEAALVGRRFDDDAAHAAGRAASAGLRPPDDLHATGEYRRDVAAVLVARALHAAVRAAAAPGTGQDPPRV